MRIKEAHLSKFKRFTDLTIRNIPNTTQLIVLVGPNGCGKSSLFDAFKTWHLLKGYNAVASSHYCKKDVNDTRNAYDLVKLDFHESISELTQDNLRSLFYFRTAYRNSPEIKVDTLKKLSSPLERANNNMMIANDATVDENYQRLVAATLSKVYDESYNQTNVLTLREELIGKIREPLRRLFPDLVLTEIGIPTDKAEFYFKKGATEKYGYEKLSGGEKAVFDLLLDMVVKQDSYINSIYCIDEPEAHIHTKLQAILLRELYGLINDQSQLWIATHSFGMLKEAREIAEDHPGSVVFLNFDGYDFDDTVILEPSTCDNTLWDKILEISLDDYSAHLSPECIVFCEGTTQGRRRKDFDARCYASIFEKTHTGTMFYSLGSCNDVEADKNAVIEFVRRLLPRAQIIRIIDRDDRSSEEIAELTNNGIRVLSRRHIESYLLDPEILHKWCETTAHTDKVEDVLKLREEKIEASIARGNAPDDIKSAGNEIATETKRLLGITACGNTGEMIMRDTISKLITPDTRIYQLLEAEIWG